jgi:uncharacterized membrane protein YeaQ/YmgE (transglycosylase-associated protein family)
MTVTGIISALIIGVIIGTLGRLILPGKQSIGAIATVVVGVGAALLGMFVARRFDVDGKAPANWNWDWIGWNLHWSWVVLGIQLAFAVVGIAIAAALSNTVIADGYRDRRRRRRTTRTR